MQNTGFRLETVDCEHSGLQTMTEHTSTENMHSAVLPSSSVATQATSVVPTSKESPESWLQAMSTEASDASEAVMADQVAVAVEVA